MPGHLLGIYPNLYITKHKLTSIRSSHGVLRAGGSRVRPAGVSVVVVGLGLVLDQLHGQLHTLHVVVGVWRHVLRAGRVSTLSLHLHRRQHGLCLTVNCNREV